MDPNGLHLNIFELPPDENRYFKVFKLRRLSIENPGEVAEALFKIYCKDKIDFDPNEYPAGYIKEGIEKFFAKSLCEESRKALEIKIEKFKKEEEEKRKKQEEESKKKKEEDKQKKSD